MPACATASPCEHTLTCLCKWVIPAPTGHCIHYSIPVKRVQMFKIETWTVNIANRTHWSKMNSKQTPHAPPLRANHGTFAMSNMDEIAALYQDLTAYYTSQYMIPTAVSFKIHSPNMVNKLLLFYSSCTIPNLSLIQFHWEYKSASTMPHVVSSAVW